MKGEDEKVRSDMDRFYFVDYHKIASRVPATLWYVVTKPYSRLVRLQLYIFLIYGKCTSANVTSLHVALLFPLERCVGMRRRLQLGSLRVNTTNQSALHMFNQSKRAFMIKVVEVFFCCF